MRFRRSVVGSWAGQVFPKSEIILIIGTDSSQHQLNTAITQCVFIKPVASSWSSRGSRGDGKKKKAVGGSNWSLISVRLK